MKIHEHQARDLLKSAGIPVPPGRVIDTPEAAADAYRQVTAEAGTTLAVVKAQVHAGGRGKAGFVKLVRSADEAAAAAKFMLSNRMVSPQTPPEGIAVKQVLIAAGVDIADRSSPEGGGAPRSGAEGATRSTSSTSSSSSSSPKEEFYLAITTDRRSRRNILIASREGGVDIEHIAATRPDAILKVPLHPLLGLQPYQARQTAFALGLKGKQVGQAADIMLRLARLYVEKDCTLAEINPLVLTSPSPAAGGVGGGGGRVREAGGGQVLAIDAKFNFDDNALFRHPELESLADPAETNPAEARAAAHGLSYIALDGNIGCLVNGAGLAMATMDIVKLEGGDPANFLDVGGSASEEAVTEAFAIILSDPKVRGILVNIFGGIMRCDIIAQGIINAARHHSPAAGGVGGGEGRVREARGGPVRSGPTGFPVPLVVRLEGTNVEAGRKLLEAARPDLPTLQPATDLADAARKVAAAVR